MKTKKIIGGIILLSIFAGFFLGMGGLIGYLETLKVISFAIVGSGIIILGTWLIWGDDE